MPVLIWVGLGLDGLLLVLAFIDARRAAAVAITASRSWPPLLVQGASAEVEVHVASGARRGLRLALREGLHPYLAERPLRRRLELVPGASLIWRYRLEPRRRGAIPLVPLTARILGPWRLAWAQRELLPASERRVYPQVRWEGRVGRLLLRAHRRELGRVQTRFRGEGGEFYALREYVPGDPTHSIHWKATARHGRPVTREEVLEAGARVVVLLDCARAMTTRAAARSKLDHALAATLALARVASARGDRVTIVAFSDRVLRSVRVRGGSRGIAKAYRQLYDLEAGLEEPAYDIAVEAATGVESRRATVVLLTSVVDLAAAELLRTSLAALGLRHRPLLVNLEDPQLRALALGVPSSAEAAFAKTSALQILLENRRLARHLRRGGVRVVVAPADRLALETLDAYLAMCRPWRGRG